LVVAEEVGEEEAAADSIFSSVKKHSLMKNFKEEVEVEEVDNFIIIQEVIITVIIITIIIIIIIIIKQINIL